MTNTINNVPRELLADLLGNDHDKRIMAERHLLAMLANAPSPAGVDGLKRYEVFPYLDDEVAEIDICESDDGSFVKYEDAQAIIDGLRGENHQRQRELRLRQSQIESSGRIAERAQRFAVQLRTERDQQAQRIGELEGLLLRVQVSLSLDDTEWGYSGAEKYKLLADIRAALSAGKEGE